MKRILAVALVLAGLASVAEAKDGYQIIFPGYTLGATDGIVFSTEDEARIWVSVAANQHIEILDGGYALMPGAGQEPFSIRKVTVPDDYEFPGE